MKLGIYGGTFDPIHIAHLIIAEYAHSELLLDTLYFVPSYIPPHKLSKTISSHFHRLDMLQLAIGNNPKFSICDFELKKQGTSFTVDTLRYFYKNNNLAKKDLFLIIGADNLADFHLWKDPDGIVNLAQIVVARRPASPAANEKYTDVLTLETPLLDISASEIRKRIREGKSVRYMLPRNVEVYIKKHGLYRE